MAKSLLRSYVDGIKNQSSGESYTGIFRYFLPEFVTALILHSILNLADACFIAQLQSTSLYATQGVTSTLIHFLTKMIEGISVGTIVLCGQYNGKRDLKEVGKAAISSFWVTFFIGFALTITLYILAEPIYRWYQVPEKMVHIGADFLRLRALGIFFSCMYFSLIGYLRGIKNTYTPMYIFLIGGLVFISLDYVLIFGAAGFPEMRMRGSALASVIQYAVMLFASFIYIFWHQRRSAHHLHLIRDFDKHHAFSVIQLSWPVMIDKAILAAAKMWLAMLIGPMGKTVLASFSVIKDMEQFAFVPAIACAQIITFLVSNDYSIQNWKGIKTNTKRMVFVASLCVFSILLLFSMSSCTIIQLFDRKGNFVNFASHAFPIISFLVFFDVLQLILSAALRGAANVKTVMLVRLSVAVVFFFPISYVLAHLPIVNPHVKFILVYGSFYVGNGIMSLIYIYRFRGEAWKQITFNPARTTDDAHYQGRDSQTRPHVTT